MKKLLKIISGNTKTELYNNSIKELIFNPKLSSQVYNNLDNNIEEFSIGKYKIKQINYGR